MRNHIIFFSGGKSSFAVADWVLERYPDDNIVLYFTDTLWEHEDLYRFIHEASDKLRLPLLTHSMGLNPIQLMFEKKLVFNSMLGECSKILKMRVAADFLKRGKRPKIEHWRNREYLKDEDFVTDATLYFGIGFDEMHRETAIKKNWQPLRVEMPLIENNIWTDEALKKWNIRQPKLYDYGFAHNNCFHGDERFITSDGIRTFRETVGEMVKVIGKGGFWRDATIKQFGKQEIVEITLSKGNGKKKVIRTTANHRWFIRKNRKNRIEVLTKDLRPGDSLWSMYPRQESTIKPSPMGIAQGIVFGDGTYPRNSWNNPATVTLCGDKVELLKYFPLNDTKEVKGVGVKVCDLPKTWKDYPDLNESKSFLLGWLMGYIATDGTVSKGSVYIHSSKIKNLEFVQKVCIKLGIAFTDISKTTRKGIDGEYSDIYSMSFIKSTFNKRFLIRKKHIEAYGAEATSRPKEWQVEEVRYTGNIEEVYCAVVPDGEMFTLDSYILTGNCNGRCVKAGQGHYKLLKHAMPEVFRKIMEQEHHLKICVSAYRYITNDKVPEHERIPDHVRERMLQELDEAYRDYFYDRAPKPKPYVHPAGSAVGEWMKIQQYAFMKRDGKPYPIRDLHFDVENDMQIDLFDIGGCGCFTEGMACEL